MKDQIKTLSLVCVIFFVVTIYYEIPYWLTQKPCSVHVWRQSDCASYALNYYQNDRGFFAPQVHHRHAINGSTCSEFPIIYYAASKIYKIFGFHDYIIRWIGYCIFFLSLIALTLTSGFFIKHWILQTFPSILLMLSCVLTYYSANYLPDAPALSFAIIGLYFFVKHYFDGRLSNFWLALFFSTLAGLLKISSAIFLVVIALFTFYNKFYKKNHTYSKSNLFAILASFLSIFSWLLFVKIYNEIGQYYGNLQGTMGIWTIDKSMFLYIIQRTFSEWFPALISYKVWIFLVPVCLYLIYYWKNIHEVLRFFLFFVSGACLFYLLSFFAVFNVHDYYFINVISFPVVLSIAFFHVLEQKLRGRALHLFLVLAFILFGMAAEDTKAQFEFRKTDVGWNSIPAKGFYTIEPYLRSLGIDRNQLIYSPSDPTTNVTLYLMNNPGWTKLFGVSPQDAIERGARYMVMDSNLLESEEFKNYKEKVIGEYQGLKVVQF